MTIRDKERVISFKKSLSLDQNLADKLLNNLSDEELLRVLNKSVVPNAISTNATKYTCFYNLVFSKDKAARENFFKSLNNLKKVYEIMSKTERDLVKYGFFFGFPYYNRELAMYDFCKNSSDPSKGELLKPKIVSSEYFFSIFPFIYNLTKKGENNERFPTI